MCIRDRYQMKDSSVLNQGTSPLAHASRLGALQPEDSDDEDATRAAQLDEPDAVSAPRHSVHLNKSSVGDSDRCLISCVCVHAGARLF